MNASELHAAIMHKRSFLCVGLDALEPSFEFNKAIIDATLPYAVAYKPNTAFYESKGAAGWSVLERTVDYLRSREPGIFLIADAKRGDIGNTTAQYARCFFERMDFDAVTLSPYMGRDAIEPFLSYPGKWAIVLALTSNPSAADFETLPLASSPTTPKPLYRQVIEVSRTWADADRMMYVVGATRPEALRDIRTWIPNHFLLVPGVGAQGGSLSEVAAAGLNSKCGLLVNASRSIIYASRGADFAVAAAAAARDMAMEMSRYL